MEELISINLNDYDKQLKKCSHCSFCQEICPVFQAEKKEAYGTCSRIILIRQCFIEKIRPFNKKVWDIINKCLLCGRCQKICPAKIPIVDIIIAVRSQLNRKEKVKSFLRTVPFSLRRKTLTRLNYLFNSFLPTEKYPFETILSSPAVGLKGHPFKKKILYYIGCATSIMDHMTGKAVLNVLHYTGVKVIMPDYQVCCGRPALAWGDIQTARNLCEKNYRLFSRIQVDAILTDCSSCRQTLKESVYKLFDKSHPFYSEMVSLSKKVYEVTEFIVTLGMAMVPNSRFQHITYHVPCHIQGDKHIETAPLKLQSKNKNLKITEMDQPNRCCGSAGIYYLKNPSIAAKLKIRKVQEIQKTHAKTVISQCPSCRFYLKQALTPEYEILHPISLFNRKE